MKILYKTIHGSRLYGLAHENSDWDYYTVVDKVKNKKAKYATHRIIDGVDSVVVDFGTWVNLCQKGVPQALEAMFSEQAEIDLIPEFRAGFVAGTNFEAYRGVMKTMAMEFDDFKHKRHVLRLGYNLHDVARDGRFNPTLGIEKVELINMYANSLDMDSCYDLAKRIAYTPYMW